MFFSDLHNGYINFEKMIDIANELKVDAVINAGDTVLKYLDDPKTDFSWYVPMIKKINAAYIPALGNHDVWVGNYWKRADPVSSYNAILSPALERLVGVSQPLEAKKKGLCYYYYDAQDIRIVVLNAMVGNKSVEFWDKQQKEWLQKILNDALEKKKQVICVNHAPFPKDIALRDPKLSWNSVIDYRVHKSNDGIYTNNEAISVVQSFIDNGGKFICWLCGHTHVDEVLTAKGYNGQIMFGIASARYSFHEDGNVIKDKNTPGFYCFDLIGIDSANGLLYRIRLGWNKDNSMRLRDALKYDYRNNIITNLEKKL